MTIQPKILALLDHCLGLRGRGLYFTAETPLLGAIPELDSLALVKLSPTTKLTAGCSRRWAT
jgi:acyl carrier protein